MILAALVLDVRVAFLEQPRQFAERLLRKNGFHFVGVCRSFRVARHGDQRETMSVGRDETHAVGTEDEQRAVEEIPRVFSGNRERRLRDHFLDRGARQRGSRRATTTAVLGERGEVLARQRLHSRVESIGGDLHAALVLGDPYVSGLRQRLHDLVELLGWQRQRAALRDGCRASTPQSHFQVGREKPDLITFGSHQDIRENRNRVFPLDDALEKLQFSQKVVLTDDKFHGCADLERAGLGPAIPWGKERFENEKLYRRRGRVEKDNVVVSA